MQALKLISERLLNLLTNSLKKWKNQERNSKDFLMRRENLLLRNKRPRQLTINCWKTRQRLNRSLQRPKLCSKRRKKQLKN